MRDRPPKASPQHKLEWPGGVVPEWARPKGNPNKRFRKGKGGGHERQGGSSPSKRERLQKVMAQSGHGSRRNIEILIAQGHITINGQVAKLGDSVGPGDKVKLDGEVIRLRFGEPQTRVLLYHKPEGEIVTRDDPEGRATVFEKLPKVQGGRWVAVGRLDLNTGGLLLFTTNGELANRLMHPRFEVEREYAVRVLGELTEEQKAKLLGGVEIEGESCKFDSIEERGGEGSNRWYHVVLREGKNREVRKMMEAVGLTVSRLMRVRFGSVLLPSFLKRGMMREMGEDDVQQLLATAGVGEVERAASDEDEEDEHDNVGNVAHPDERLAPLDDEEIDEEEDNFGNRADLPPREADGNRPGQPGAQRRAPGPGPGPGAGPKRPFFKKRGRGGGQGQPGQGQSGQGQPGQGQPGQGQPRAHGQGHGQKKPQGQAQGGPPAQGSGQPGGKSGRRRNRHRNRNRGGGEARGEQQPQNNGNREPV